MNTENINSIWDLDEDRFMLLKLKFFESVGWIDYLYNFNSRPCDFNYFLDGQYFAHQLQKHDFIGVVVVDDFKLYKNTKEAIVVLDHEGELDMLDDTEQCILKNSVAWKDMERELAGLNERMTERKKLFDQRSEAVYVNKNRTKQNKSFSYGEQDDADYYQNFTLNLNLRQTWVEDTVWLNFLRFMEKSLIQNNIQTTKDFQIKQRKM